jgi:hypothetical protein
MDASGTPKASLLLAALLASTYRRLFPHLESTTLVISEPLHRFAEPLRFAYSPTSRTVTVSHAIEKDGPTAEALAGGLRRNGRDYPMFEQG